jgi:uncharacterized membrane protein YkvA (DUF1232 family)
MEIPRLDIDRFRRKLEDVADRVPFASEALAMFYCATDSRTPARVKAILIGALAYFVMPADLIPDFVAVLGFTDDAATLFTAWSAVQPYVTEAHRERAKSKLARILRRRSPAPAGSAVPHSEGK